MAKPYQLSLNIGFCGRPGGVSLRGLWLQVANEVAAGEFCEATLGIKAGASDGDRLMADRWFGLHPSGRDLVQRGE